MTVFPRKNSLFVIAAASLMAAGSWTWLNSGKPFIIDDTFFLSWARAVNPLPGEKRATHVNWEGIRDPIDNSNLSMGQTVNYPPGWPILISLARRVAGDSETVLHWLQLPFAAMFLAGASILGSIHGAPWPLVFGLCAVSPVFLLPVSSLMADVACAGPGVLGLAVWAGASGPAALTMAALLLILSAQIKQTIYPLLLLLVFSPAGSLVRDRKKILFLLAVVALSSIYPPVAGATPGGFHNRVIWILGWVWDTSLVLPKIGYAWAVYSALAIFPSAFIMLSLGRRRGAPEYARLKAFSLAAVIFAVVSAFGFWKGTVIPMSGMYFPSRGSIPPVPVGWNWLWFISASLCFLVWCVLSVPPLLKTRARWLLIWLALVLVGSILGTPFPAARFHLFALPPLAILLALDLKNLDSERLRRVLFATAMAGSLWLSFSLEINDTMFAAFGRDSAHRGARLAATAGLPLLTTGHWGHQFYVEKLGGKVLDQSEPPPARGAILLVPDLTDHNIVPARYKARIMSRTTWVGPPAAGLPFFMPARTIPPRETSASFQAGHAWLPYAFAEGPLETMTVFRISPERGK